ncbi:MAG TPA: hypothetical protein ENN81_10845, partial [Phycisphaerales bacterium]|nr:hypothetical protein [Phycisphaerales bacterium]
MHAAASRNYWGPPKEVFSMTCHDYKDLMMGYLDDELTPEQRNRFEIHLSGCDSCRADLKQFRKLKAITDEVTLAEPEDRLWQDYWCGV